MQSAAALTRDFLVRLRLVVLVGELREIVPMKKLRIPGGGDGLLVLQTQLKHGNFRDDEGCEASFTQHRSRIERAQVTDIRVPNKTNAVYESPRYDTPNDTC